MPQQLHSRRAEGLSRADVYTRVTNQIIQAIEAGAGEYVMPWHSANSANQFPKNAVTGKLYRGVNVISLWAAAQVAGYPEAVWATYRQWGELGHQVRSGEKAAYGVFWKPLDAKDNTADNAESEDRSDDDTTRWIARAFPLFNAAQVEGYQAPSLPARPDHERIEEAEEFVAALHADIRHGGNRAYYRPSSDHIQMPPFEAFVDPIGYYATMLHEIAHWTGHPSRLNRELKNRFGSESYAAEELIAEIGAAFMAADLDICPEPNQACTAYINNWLTILKKDKRAIFTAASHVQRAADYIHCQQPCAFAARSLPDHGQGTLQPASA